jgi:hypothetical protein
MKKGPPKKKISLLNNETPLNHQKGFTQEMPKINVKKTTVFANHVIVVVSVPDAQDVGGGDVTRARHHEIVFQQFICFGQTIAFRQGTLGTRDTCASNNRSNPAPTSTPTSKIHHHHTPNIKQQQNNIS